MRVSLNTRCLRVLTETARHTKLEAGTARGSRDEATEAAMSTHRMGRDRFPYGPAQPEELPPDTHWMDYDTLEEVRT